MNSLSPLVRRANRVDAGQIIALINAVCAEGQYFSTPHYVPTPQWEAALYHPEEAPDHLLYVAEDAGVIIGEAQILPCEDQPGVGELGIGVYESYRGRKVGSELLAQLLKEAKLYYNKIVLYVLITNDRALHVFEKAGFHEQGRRYHDYAHLGKQEQLVMQLKL
ncbi:MAG: GNAT family N-acetyltransferase [Chloroflexi bacterium]|nr:GNAT family N-acetyltransferase [Chloroflexota bacterium]